MSCLHCKILIAHSIARCISYRFSVLISSIKKKRVLQVFKTFLKRWNWLIKVYRKTHSCEIFAHVVFDNWPKTNALFLLNRIWKLLSPCYLRVPKIIDRLRKKTVLQINALCVSFPRHVRWIQISCGPTPKTKFCKILFSVIVWDFIFIWHFLHLLFLNIIRWFSSTAFWKSKVYVKNIYQRLKTRSLQ